jgi:hypothetical protein
MLVALQWQQTLSYIGGLVDIWSARACLCTFRIDRKKKLIISLSLVFLIVFASTIVTMADTATQQLLGIKKLY